MIAAATGLAATVQPGQSRADLLEGGKVYSVSTDKASACLYPLYGTEATVTQTPSRSSSSTVSNVIAITLGLYMLPLLSACYLINPPAYHLKFQRLALIKAWRKEAFQDQCSGATVTLQGAVLPVREAAGILVASHMSSISLRSYFLFNTKPRFLQQ